MSNEKVQMSIQCQITKSKYQILLFIMCIPCSLQSQVIDTDTSDVVIRKTSKEKPAEFNISDVIIKMDKEKTKHVLRADLEIPVSTSLKLNVTDSLGEVIMYLINDQTLKAGVYRVKWEMPSCTKVSEDLHSLDCYPSGKYLCSFETDQFIYQKDFYLR